jgi:hypothetical protein
VKINTPHGLGVICKSRDAGGRSKIPQFHGTITGCRG